MSSPWSAQPFVPAGHAFNPDEVVDFVPGGVASDDQPLQEQPWTVDDRLCVIKKKTHRSFFPSSSFPLFFQTKNVLSNKRRKVLRFQACHLPVRRTSMVVIVRNSRPRFSMLLYGCALRLVDDVITPLFPSLPKKPSLSLPKRHEQTSHQQQHAPQMMMPPGGMLGSHQSSSSSPPSMDHHHHHQPPPPPQQQQIPQMMMPQPTMQMPLQHQHQQASCSSPHPNRLPKKKKNISRQYCGTSGIISNAPSARRAMLSCISSVRGSPCQPTRIADTRAKLLMTSL